MKKVLFFAFLAAAAGYWLVLSQPALYYGKSLEYKSFTLRSREELPAGTAEVLDRAMEKLSAAEFFSPDAKFDVYLTGSREELRFFCPYAPGDYARVSPLNGGIFLAAADFAGDRVRSVPEASEFRVLSKVIAGSAVRELVRRRLKPLTYLFMSDWKILGYCERVSATPGQFSPQDICSAQAPAGSALLDYEYGLAVDFVMNEEKISFADLLDKNYSYESVGGQVKKRYCGK